MRVVWASPGRRRGLCVRARTWVSTQGGHLLLDRVSAFGGVRRFWGWNAIALGGWEALAMTTRLPTISRSVWWLMRRHPLFARLLLGLWLGGLIRHLARPPS